MSQVLCDPCLTQDLVLDKCSEWEKVLVGRGCAAAKQRNKSRKKKTQESGNMMQNRKVVKQIPGMRRNRTDRLTALQQAYGRSQARSEQTDRRSQRSISGTKETF